MDVFGRCRNADSNRSAPFGLPKRDTWHHLMRSCGARLRGLFLRALRSIFYGITGLRRIFARPISTIWVHIAVHGPIARPHPCRFYRFYQDLWKFSLLSVSTLSRGLNTDRRCGDSPILRSGEGFVRVECDHLSQHPV